MFERNTMAEKPRESTGSGQTTVEAASAVSSDSVNTEDRTERRSRRPGWSPRCDVFTKTVLRSSLRVAPAVVFWCKVLSEAVFSSVVVLRSGLGITPNMMSWWNVVPESASSSVVMAGAGLRITPAMVFLCAVGYLYLALDTDPHHPFVAPSDRD